MIITATMLDLSSVTFEMIGRAHKAFEADGTAFYMVENSRGLVNLDGNLIEYKVTWNRKKGFQCTCESGQYGFANCGAKKVCQHVLAACAASNEEKEALAALTAKTLKNTQYALNKREHYLEVDGQEVSEEEYNRIMNAKPAKTSKREHYSLTSNKGFQLMK